MAEVDEIIEQPSESEKRIKTLSGKVKETAEERDELKRLGVEKDEKISSLEKENTFNSGFSDIVSANPSAKDFKDDIKSKVMTGMSMEDATFAVLGKAGKLGAPQGEIISAAGGSASTGIIQPQQDKSIGEMTQAERREALASSPDLADILAPKRQ